AVGQRRDPRPGTRPAREPAAARDEGAPGTARGPRDPRAAAGAAGTSAGGRAGGYARAGHRRARQHGRSLAALLRGLRDRLARARDARPPPRGVARRPRPAAARDRAPGARPARAAAPRRLKALTAARPAVYLGGRFLPSRCLNYR